MTATAAPADAWPFRDHLTTREATYVLRRIERDGLPDARILAGLMGIDRERFTGFIARNPDAVTSAEKLHERRRLKAT